MRILSYKILSGLFSYEMPAGSRFLHAAEWTMWFSAPDNASEMPKETRRFMVVTDDDPCGTDCEYLGTFRYTDGPWHHLLETDLKQPGEDPGKLPNK